MQKDTIGQANSSECLAGGTRMNFGESWILLFRNCFLIVDWIKKIV